MPNPGWKLRLEDRLGLLDPIALLVFRSYATADAVRVRGRVIERKGVQGTAREAPLWRNVLNTLQRLDSDEIPGARVRAVLQGRAWETVTDHEGYFALDLDPAEPLGPGWHQVTLELLDSVGEPERRRVREPVLVPSPDAEFGVISDLDDTVLRTRANDLAQEVAIVFGNNARTRTPFPGVPALYRALARGPDDRGSNPLFYVSMSGWNLYDLLEEFLDLQEIPLGPLFLSDLRVIEAKSPALGQDEHKRESIETLLRTYPDLRWILIGDSGQTDPELYRDLARAHPGRILAVYIHDVSPAERDQEVARISEELEAEGVPLLRMETTLEAAADAARRGFISERGLREVRAQVDDAADEAADDAAS